jgi:hypothetical protein
MSKFVEKPDINNPYEYKLDTSLKDKISQWAPAFVSYLIHIYTTMYDIPNKEPEPAEVTASTAQYRKEQDIFREFYDSNIEYTNDKKDVIRRRDLASCYKLWHKEDHDGTPIPKGKALNDYFEKVLRIKSNGSGFIGIKFKKDISSSSGDEMMEEINDMDRM